MQQQIISAIEQLSAVHAKRVPPQPTSLEVCKLVAQSGFNFLEVKQRIYYMLASKQLSSAGTTFAGHELLKVAK